MPFSSNILKFHLFADDTSIFFSHKNLSQLELIVNDELSKVSDWLVANKLTLNVDKSNFLIISPSIKNKTNEIKLAINNKSIAQKDCIKYLGVLLDKDISWKQHIQQVNLKISIGIGILAKARHYVPPQILRNFYFSFIEPHVNYALINWGSANLSSLKPMGRNLNKAGLRSMTSHTTLLR